MFAHASLRMRLMLIVLAAFIGMVVLATISAFNAKARLLEDHKAQVRSGVQGIFNAVSFLQKQEAEGKLTRAEAQRQAHDLIRNARYGGSDGKSEYYYAWTLEGVSIAHVKTELEGQNMLEKIKDAQGRYTIRDLIDAVKNAPDAYVDTQFPRPGGNVALPKLQYVMKFPAWNWLIGTGIYTDDIDAEFKDILLHQLATALILVALIGAMSFVLARGVLHQIGGEPKQAADVMRAVASGNLTASIGNAPPDSLLGALDTMVKALRDLVQEVRAHADSLVSNAEQIKHASEQVAEAAEHQSDATSAMASAIEQLTVSSNHISDSAHETESDSHEAMSLANAGTQRVEEATQAIQQIATTVSDASVRIQALEQRAEQVSSIANVIKDIAGQTNLLALNAAIEAARAGEQGRGFAVVADEVRKLAERTSLATTEIEQTISGIQSETSGAVAAMSAALPEVEQGVRLATSASDSLRGIETGAQRTLERVVEVANATREQSSASTAIAQRVEDIAQRVEQTTHTIRDTAASANRLEAIAQDLMQQIARFQV